MSIPTPARPLSRGREEGAEGRRRFQFCIERSQRIGRLFSATSPNRIFVILEARLPDPRMVSRRTRCCGSEASEAIPFPGPDSIFSIRCGAISRRLPFCRRALSRRDPGDRNASVQKIDNRLGRSPPGRPWELANFCRLEFSSRTTSQSDAGDDGFDSRPPPLGWVPLAPSVFQGCLIFCGSNATSFHR
jgi:hypothetical protein